MTRLLETGRVLGYAALSGFLDSLGAVYTWPSWLFGLFARMLAQVAFFASLGRLLGSSEHVQFLLVGNAVLVAASSSLTATVATQGERDAGTLPLLVASPSSPLLVLLGRSVSFIPNGLITALGAFVIVGPLFDIVLPWPRLPLLLALLVLVAMSTYLAATFLGGLVLRATGARRTVANVGRLTMMAFCGVSVPRDLFPVVIERGAGLLPLTHGLDAIRELFGAARAEVILANASLEVLVAAGWLTLSLATFQRLADAGRRDGSIVFASA